MTPSHVLFGQLRRAFTLVLLVGSFSIAAAAEPKVAFDVPAGEASSTLKQFAKQAGREIMFPAQPVNGVKTNAVSGELTVQEALDQLLAGTNLRAYQDDRTGGLVVQLASDPNGPRVAQAAATRMENQDGQAKDGILKLEAFEVMESKLLNMDKPRSRDDAQPYVVFNRETIELSGVDTLDGFFRERLTMNQVASSNAQTASTTGPSSTINLRGLGQGQTLILIDGHRTANSYQGSSPFQPDVNGIPLAAIERIEVLPTTASGIYGGSATGGVINIILRRDYAGVEAKTTYENSFQSDTGVRRFDLSAGYTFNEGRTSLIFAGMASDANQLLAQDRDYTARARARIMANNPLVYFSPSALPPLGGTTNIRSANGSPLFGPGTSFFTFIPVGYAGGGGLTPLLANAGHYNFDLANSQQPFGGGRQSLYSAPTIYSGMVTVRHELSANLQVFAEARASNTTAHTANLGVFPYFSIAATAPNNPFGQALTVTVPSDGLDATIYTTAAARHLGAGVVAKLPADWQGEFDYSWDRYRSSRTTETNFGALSANVSNGTFDVLRDTHAFPLDLSAFKGVSYTAIPFVSISGDAALRFSGPVKVVPGHDTTLSVLLEHRDEWMSSSRQNGPNGDSYFPSRSQSTDSAYLEAVVPLITVAQQIPAIHELQLQLAARTDNYSVDGVTSFVTVGSTTPIVRVTDKTHSTNPTIGLRYLPTSDVILRASYGTGFLPPNVSQLNPDPTLTTSGGATDPKRGFTTLGTYQSTTGGNPALRPEKSKSWSAGVVYTPDFVKGLRFSVDYTRITKSDNITSLSLQQLLDNENVFPGRITRGTLPVGDPYTVGPVTAVDRTSVNVSTAEVIAYDYAVDYEWKSELGTFDVFGNATSQPHFKTQVVPTQPEVDSAGISPGNSAGYIPLKFKASAGITWRRGRWTTGWAMQYFDSYQVAANPTGSGASTVLSQGSLRVKDQIFHDVFVKYRWAHSTVGSAWARILDDSEVQVSVKDVFNSAPAYDAAQSIFSYYSQLADPRQARYSVSWKKTF